MSKKYVPSFLKDQQSTTPDASTQSTSNSFWPGQKSTTVLNTTNKFAALSDDFPMRKEKPVVNTSLPAKEAPKLVPATLASLTSNGNGPISTTGSGPKKSFAAKFAEQAKIAEDPNYVPPPKPVDLKSEEDFPSLGAPKKTPTTGAWGAKPVQNEVVKPTGPSFADKAKEWANKKAEDEEKARKKALREERLRREAELIKSMPRIGFIRKNYYDEDDEEEDEYNPYDESSLGDSDSFGCPDDDQEPSDNDGEEEEDSEFNQNVGWDGRRRDDLY